jgi:hypothetical protein
LAICELISYVITSKIKKDQFDLIGVFCKDEAVKYVKELGFDDPSWEENPVAVILFEKDLRK